MGRPRDGSEFAIRFIFGAVLGIAVGIYWVVELSVDSIGFTIGVVAASALICGLLAARYGDRFWYRFFGVDE